MEEQTEESTEQKYTKADMASLLYPIYTNEENYQNPEWVDGEFNKVLETYPEDQWDEEALTYFSTQYDDYKKAAKIKNYKDTSPLENIPFPEFTEEDTEETKVAKLEQWGEETKAARHKEDPVWYHKNKFEANEFIDGFVQQEKRKALGEDSGVIRDTISRIGQGAADFIANTLNASDDTLESIDDFFEENPKYDGGYRADISAGVGQAGPQLGAATAGAGAAMLAASAVGGPVTLAGGLAFAGINALLSGKNIHKQYYDEAYRMTGNEALASEIALRNTPLDVAPEVLLDSVFGGKIAGRMFKGMSKSTQVKAISGKMAVAKTASTEALTEGVQESIQSISSQITSKQFTGENVNPDKVSRDAIVGAAAGGIVAGGMQTATEVVSPSESTLLSREKRRLANKKKAQEAADKLAKTTDELKSLKDSSSSLQKKGSLPQSEFVRVGAELEKFAEGSIKQSFMEYPYLRKEDMPSEVLQQLDLVAIEQPTGGVKVYKDTPKNKKLLSKERTIEDVLNRDEFEALTKTALANRVAELNALPPTKLDAEGQGLLPLGEFKPAKLLDEKGEFKRLMEEAAKTRKDLARIAKEKAPDPRQSAFNFEAPKYPETTIDPDGQINLPLPKTKKAQPLKRTVEFKKLMDEADQARKLIAKIAKENAPDPRQEALDFSPPKYPETTTDPDGQLNLPLPDFKTATPFDYVGYLNELVEQNKQRLISLQKENKSRATKDSKPVKNNKIKELEKTNQEILEKIKAVESALTNTDDPRQVTFSFDQKTAAVTFEDTGQEVETEPEVEEDTNTEKRKELEKALKAAEKQIRDSYPPPVLEKSDLEHIEANELPQKIAELQAELEAIPTMEMLKERIATIPQMLAQIELEVKKSKLTPDQEVDLLGKVATLADIYTEALKNFQKETRGGKLTKRRKALERDIKMLQDRQVTAEAGYSKTKAKGVTPSMVRSNATGAVFSTGIDPNLRAYTNALIGAFGLEANDININMPDAIVVATADEFAAGVADDLYTGETQETILNLKKKLNRSKANKKYGKAQGAKVLATKSNLARDTKVPHVLLITVADGAFNEENAAILAHEVGHGVQDIIFKNASESVQQEVFDEFDRARKAALYTDENIIESFRKIGDFPSRSDSRVIPITSKLRRHPGYQYKFSKEKGYKEWFANQVSHYALNPETLAVSGAQKMMKTLGDFFYKIWSTFNDFFPQQAPTLRSWLDHHFDSDTFKQLMTESQKDFQSVANKSRSKKPKNLTGIDQIDVTIDFMLKMEHIGKQTSEDTGDNRSRLAERIYDSTDNEIIKNKTKDLFYEKLKLDATLKEIQRDVNDDNAQSYAAEFLKSIDDVNINESIKGLYGIAITNQLVSMGDRADSTEVANGYYDLAGTLHEKLSFAAVQRGQMISSLRMLGKLSPKSRQLKMQREIERMYEKMKVELPFNYKEVIAEIEKKYRQELQQYNDGFMSQEVYRRMHKDLEEQMGLLAPTSPFNFYWYGNMLSSPKTLAINFGGPVLDLLFRQMAHLAVNPKDIPVTLSALGKAFSKGLTAWKASQQGIDIRSVLSDKYGFKHSAITPYVQWNNKKAEKTVNWFLKLLEKYPFRIMRGTDMMIATTAYEIRAHTAAAAALREAAKDVGAKLTSYDLAQRIDRKLGQTEERVKKYTERAEKEVDKLYDFDMTKKKDAAERSVKIKLRVMELMDNYRRSESPEVYQEAERYGALITYNNKPEGTFGAVANAVELLNEELGRRVGNRFASPIKYTVMPFVGVVSNVISRHLDYSPIGIVRGAMGLHKGEGGNHILFLNDTPFSKAESWERAVIGTVSTAMLGGFAAYVAAAMEEADDKGERPEIEWTATGPKDPSRRKDWLSKGNQPYSIRVGDTIFKYNEIPGAPLLAAFGGMFDAMRYSNDWEKEEVVGRAGLVMSAYGSSVLDMSFLKGFSNFIDMVKGKKSYTGLPGTFVAGLTPGSGALNFTTTDVIHGAGIMDANKLDYNDVKAHFIGRIPFLRGFVKEDYNVFGEPIPQGGRFLDSSNPDPVFKFLAANDLSVPGTTTHTIGSGRTKAEKRWLAWAKANREDLLQSRYYGETLTEEEYEKVIKLSGPRIKAKIQALMNVQARYSKAEMQKIVRKIATDERRRAKFEVISESLK